MTSWIETARAHPRHLVLAGLIAGLLAGSRAPVVLPVLIAVAFVLAPRPPVAAAIALAVAGGGLAGHARMQAVTRSALAPLLGHAVTGRAILLEPPRPGRFGEASALVRWRGERVLLRGPARASWAAAGAGAEVALRGTARAPDRFARLRGAHAVLAADGVTPTGRRRAGLLGALDGVRRRAEAALRTGLPPPEAALLRGMVLGQDQGLPPGLRDDFRAAGLSHLVAASGQNVMLLAALALGIGAALGIGLRARLFGLLGLIVAYVPLAGGGPSIQRAGVMGAAGVAAGLAGRPASRWYALGLAAAATLAHDPRAPADAGWQMSFAAVLAIGAVGTRWRDALTRRGAPPALAEAAALTAAAGLATAPIVAWHFDRVSLASLPANVLAAPAVAPIMWLGMVAAAVGQVAPPLAAPFVAVAAYPLGYLAWLAHGAAQAPGAAISASPWAAAAVGAVVLLAGARSGSFLGAPVRRWAPVAAIVVACALLLPAVSAPSPPATPGHLRITFLDVGQGDATLVQDGGAAMLVDSGPPDGGVVARLRAAGVRRLDVLVVTHAQADHEGGAAAVLRTLAVGLVVDGRDGVRTPDGDHFAAEALRRGVRLLVPDAGQVLRAGRLELRILSPRRERVAAHAGEDPNQRAVVAVLRDGPLDMLLTADAESDVLSTLDLPAVEVLKVAHHGSADPGLGALLTRLRPVVAVISVGARNAYGHPAPATVRTLAASVPSVYRTDRDGTVRLDAAPGGLEARTHA